MEGKKTESYGFFTYKLEINCKYFCLQALFARKYRQNLDLL